MGRGRHYGKLLRCFDAAQRRVYGAGWAARLAYGLGLQGPLHTDARAFRFGEESGGRALRVAFVSDVHSGPLTDPRLLREAIGQIAAAAPDLVLLGGDYVSVSHHDIAEIARLLAGLRAPLGVFGVLGNHDLWQDHVAISQALADSGVRILINEELRLPAPFQRVALYGMDDPGTGEPQPPPHALGEGEIRLVLMHAPVGLRYLIPGSFHLAFCGHTHGGQIALPSGVPIVLPPASGDRRRAGGGLFPVNGGQLLVSRGLGFSDLPVRIFARPELHLCTIDGVGSGA